MTKNRAAPELRELRSLRELQGELAHIFPSRYSLDWELRSHRREYVAAGAIVEIAGRILAHPARFAEVAVRIGARKVAERIDPGR